MPMEHKRRRLKCQEETGKAVTRLRRRSQSDVKPAILCVRAWRSQELARQLALASRPSLVHQSKPTASVRNFISGPIRLQAVAYALRKPASHTSLGLN